MKIDGEKRNKCNFIDNYQIYNLISHKIAKFIGLPFYQIMCKSKKHPLGSVASLHDTCTRESVQYNHMVVPA